MIRLIEIFAALGLILINLLVWAAPLLILLWLVTR